MVITKEPRLISDIYTDPSSVFCHFLVDSKASRIMSGNNNYVIDVDDSNPDLIIDIWCLLWNKYSIYAFLSE